MTNTTHLIVKLNREQTPKSRTRFLIVGELLGELAVCSRFIQRLFPTMTLLDARSALRKKRTLACLAEAGISLAGASRRDACPITIL